MGYHRGQVFWGPDPPLKGETYPEVGVGFGTFSAIATPRLAITTDSELLFFCWPLFWNCYFVLSQVQKGNFADNFFHAGYPTVAKPTV